MSRHPGERWAQFAERIANAFGLVLVLVLATYVLGSLTPFHGLTGALTTTVACLAAVVGLAGAASGHSFSASPWRLRSSRCSSPCSRGSSTI